MAVSKTQAKAVIIKKKWYNIHAPKLFQEKLIGETYAAEAEPFVGKYVAVSMMMLTGEPQKQNISLKFKIVSCKDNVLATEFVSLDVLPASLKKLSRRRRDKIEDSIVVKTADDMYLQIKPLAVTRGKTTGSILTAMRKLQRAYIATVISKTKTEDLLRDIFQKKLQRNTAQVLKPIYPVYDVEIRKLNILTAERVKELKLKILSPPENPPDFLPKPAQKPVPKETSETQQDQQETSQDDQQDIKDEQEE